MKKYLALLTFGTALLLPGASFHAGTAGKAFRGRTTAVYDSEKVTPRSGSVLFWFRVDEKADLSRDTIMLCFGVNKPGWGYLRLGRGTLGMNFRVGKGFSRFSAPANGVKQGKWHHLAVVWGIRKEKGFARIYLDGALRSYQRLTLPEKFSPGKLAVGYNSGHWKSPDFPGLIDELALFDVPVSEEMLRKAVEAGKAGKAFPPMPGRVLYMPFEGSVTPVTGAPTAPEDAKGLLKAAYRKVKVRKYPDEVDFTYSYSVPTNEKTPSCLSDGNNSTGVQWRQVRVSVTGELESSTDVTEIEIVTRKYTKWYLLKQLRVSWDDGSGVFNDPVVINTYACGKKISKKNIDESCREYVYSVKAPGKMCRFKITPVGEGYYGINEIRIRAKK